MSRAHSSRVYGDPVNVQARDDGRPARFVWRGRLYTVRAILEHWVISREWWQDPGGPGPEPGQLELEFWRIEASPGQGLAAAFYELRREAASGAWMLRPHLGPPCGTPAPWRAQAKTLKEACRPLAGAGIGVIICFVLFNTAVI